MTKKAIPSYANPPVVEVIWGVQFPRLPWLTAAHTGLYWETIRKDYPRCEEQALIERWDEPQDLFQPKPLMVELFPKPPLCRQWFVSKSGNELVQLQSDRFCVNWRKVKAGDIYPRYDCLRKSFEARWQEFCRFIKGESGEELQVDILEMTYVNHIFRDEGWSSPKDIGKILPAISFHEQSDFLPPPATLGSNMVFDIRGPKGRLHVQCHHAWLLEVEKREVFRLE